MRFLQKSLFVLRFRIFKKVQGYARNIYYKILGMKIGKGTILPKIFVTWANQVEIGIGCKLEHGIFFKYAGIWKKETSIKIGNNVTICAFCEFNISDSIKVGDNTLIASGCKFIDHNHGTKLGIFIGTQPEQNKGIYIGSDVWLGFNVIVLKGVVINNGAVVAAGSVVTKSIPPNEIWGGIPARKIGHRL